MKKQLYLILLMCCVCIALVIPSSLYATPLSIQLGQTTAEEVVLEIYNEVEQTICYVYVAIPMSTTPDQNRLLEVQIETGQTYSLSLVPGDYDLLLADCNGNPLLIEKQLNLHYDHELSLTEDDITSLGCNASNQAGTDASRLSRYTEALEALEAALTCFRHIGRVRDEGIVLTNIGAVYDAQGNYTQALEQFMQALAIARQTNDRILQGANLNNIGAVYAREGRYAQALTSYRQALMIHQQINDRSSEGTSFNNIGFAYWLQGRYGEAFEQYEQALAIQQEINDRSGQSVTFNNIGLIYTDQGRYVEALDQFEQSLAIRQNIDDQAGEGIVLNNMGVIYLNQGNYDKAHSHLEQALAIRQAIGDQSGEAATLINLAELYRIGENHEAALKTAERAVSILHTIGDRYGESTAHAMIGTIYEVQKRYDDALNSFNQAIVLLEDIRAMAGNDTDRTQFIEQFANGYDQVIQLYIAQEKIPNAFWYSERGRARVLLDTTATGKIQLSDNEANALLAAEHEAYAVRQAARNTLARALTANPLDPAWVNEDEESLAQAEAAYAQAASAITAYSDQLASLVPGRQQVLQLDEIQALLDASTTLLSYWTLENQTLAFIITAQDVTIVELPGVTAQSVLTLTESLYAWRNLDNPHPAPLRQLYQALIAPLREHLTTTHLAIIPHQSLHYVPFAALVDVTEGKHYLSEQYTLSILPSANLIPFLQQNAAAAQANPDGGAVVFGDPAVTEADLPPLHYAQEEANQVATLLHTVALTATAATETTLRQAAAGARIVHLAAHGAYNQANALYSAIYLAPSASVTATQSLTPTAGLPTIDTTLDGRLETHEIFGLPLVGNDLVVLSACETNIGDLSRGDELVGLTRAFFFAGTPTVISSLWNVDDAATETLMVAFYRHWLEEGMSKAAALQAAQAEVRSNPRWVSPFYWAGFVLNGDPGYSKVTP